MDQSLAALLGPSSALIIGLATFVLSQRRAQQTDDRAAAKDTVEILAIQNRTLLAEVADLRSRMTMLETDRKTLARELKASETERRKLLVQVERLAAQLEQATLAIRSDLAANTEISQAAFHEANDIKSAVASAIEQSNLHAEQAGTRLDRLEHDDQAEEAPRA